MTLFYRVHPYLPTAKSGESGHALFVFGGTKAGRVDNEEYDTLYVADSAAGAIAETFASHQVWTPGLLGERPYLPGSQMAISTLEGNPTVVNLNDPANLVDLSLRPSRVVTRNRQITQAWAQGVYERGGVDGVSWWSYHDPDWASLGLWDWSGLTLLTSTVLVPAYPPLVEARSMLNRPWRAA